MFPINHDSAGNDAMFRMVMVTCYALKWTCKLFGISPDPSAFQERLAFRRFQAYHALREFNLKRLLLLPNYLPLREIKQFTVCRVLDEPESSVVMLELTNPGTELRKLLTNDA